MTSVGVRAAGDQRKGERASCWLPAVDWSG